MGHRNLEQRGLLTPRIKSPSLHLAIDHQGLATVCYLSPVASLGSTSCSQIAVVSTVCPQCWLCPPPCLRSCCALLHPLLLRHTPLLTAPAPSAPADLSLLSCPQAPCPLSQHAGVPRSLHVMACSTVEAFPTQCCPHQMRAVRQHLI